MRVIARSALVLIACLLIFGGLFSTSVAQEATPAGDCPTTTEEENAALVERWFAVWNAGDATAFDELIADDFAHAWAQGTDTSSTEEFKARFEQFNGAFGDLEVTVDAMYVAGDVVTARWTVTGTHDGEFFNVESTGKAVSWTGMNIFRIECGEIVEAWNEMDTLGLLQQLGAPGIPATPVD